MVFVRTTPPRPVDVTAVFPELAPLARAAIRLHPRPGSPSVRDSSVGGPLLWPAEEPWPHCGESHQGSGFAQQTAAVRLERRVQARLRRDPDGPRHTPEEAAAYDRNNAAYMEVADADLPWTWDAPTPMLPVAQLYARDVPLLRPPGRADLLQVLWCPYDHDAFPKPSTALFWRSAAEVGEVLAVPPEPFEVDWEGYVPGPCLLAPEAITEYPDSLDLSPELRLMVNDPSRWRAAGVALDASYADYPRGFYDAELAKAPGWKAGGWPPWGRTDPYPRFCAVCEARMVPLLTITSVEWDRSTHGWIPYEDRACALAGTRVPGQRATRPTGVEVGSTDNMQLYVCPAAPEHPHTDLIQ
ncbi:hypothetical protein ABT143_08545 [Streptomyces sp. NPDC002033]|uniref:hypothetical protein n=1 Tax=unclassified Streptomyces TaxID=2593676 RepID=UPI0033175F2B